MDKWASRAKKLQNRKMNKSYGKSFKKDGQQESRKKEKIRIREAQRAKYLMLDEDTDNSSR